MGESVTQNQLNEVINNLNSNIINTGNNLQNNLNYLENSISNNLEVKNLKVNQQIVDELVSEKYILSNNLEVKNVKILKDGDITLNDKSINYVSDIALKLRDFVKDSSPASINGAFGGVKFPDNTPNDFVESIKDKLKEIVVNDIRINDKGLLFFDWVQTDSVTLYYFEIWTNKQSLNEHTFTIPDKWPSGETTQGPDSTSHQHFWDQLMSIFSNSDYSPSFLPSIILEDGKNFGKITSITADSQTYINDIRNTLNSNKKLALESKGLNHYIYGLSIIEPDILYVFELFNNRYNYEEWLKNSSRTKFDDINNSNSETQYLVPSLFSPSLFSNLKVND